MVHALLWYLFNRLVPAHYKQHSWSNGKSFAVKYFIAILILSSFHFYTLALHFQSSLEFFFGLGLPLSFLPTLYFIALESRKPAKEKVLGTAPVFEESASELLFIETQSAYIKRWNKPQTRRPQVYAYYEAGDKVECKLTKFDTLEEFMENQTEKFLVPYHKSYCINPNKIVAGIGNSKSFSVIMGSLGYEVPISREETENIIVFLKQKNVLIFATLQAYGKKTIPIWQMATR